MSGWPPPPRDQDLERADDLLDQADALLRRHRGQAEPGPQPLDGTHDPGPAFDDDDLPILTEIVDDLDLPPGWSEPRPPTPLASAPAPSPPLADQAALRPETPAAQQSPRAQQAALAQHLAERLVQLDTEIAREVADWVAVEFQQVLDRELARLGERLHAEMLAHLRATLLPELSARVSTLLDDGLKPTATPDRS